MSLRGRRLDLLVLVIALTSSGVAAIINQTVWQRSLKIYLAGAETTSSLIVVLTFMLGLGAGALVGARIASRSPRPLWVLVFVEVGLVAANVVIALALSRDLSESIYGLQRLAVSVGLPLSAVYGLLTGSALLGPCLLMGMTMPLASEAAQRQLGRSASSVLMSLFVLNTLGSALGGLASGFYLLPLYGQLRTLFVAITANAVAAALAFSIANRSVSSAAPPPVRFGKGRLTRDEHLGFWLGVGSLAYEVVLFRYISLWFEPLPYNFTIVVVGFLTCWSLGLGLANLIPGRIPALLFLTALAVASVPAIGLPAIFLPCVLFGAAFGQTMARCAQQWGRDVGRFYALNTLGCCTGIPLVTFIGFEFHPTHTSLAIASLYLVLFVAEARPTTWAVRFALVGAGAWIVVADLQQIRLDAARVTARGDDSRSTAYYGRDGVVDISTDRQLYLDGLWHSRLARDDDYVGTKNWLMAAIPFIAHANPIDDALVVGLGTGITAVTLAQSDRVRRVDAYEVNHTLERVLHDYPTGTLRALTHPKIKIHWQDGRSGLALRHTRYDLITSAPLYLKQAGSSILLSREYFMLVKARLRPEGVFAVYSNDEQRVGQAELVRRTIADVFPFWESFAGGYLILASTSPIVFSSARVDSFQPDTLTQQVRLFGLDKVDRLLDRPRLEWRAGVPIITDDHPLVEYPSLVMKLDFAK